MNMYFTVIPMNISRQQTQRIIDSPQVAHSAVLDSFPQPVDPEAQGRVLWRIDRSARHEVALIIVSPTKPVPLHLVESAGWDNGHDGYRVHDYGAVMARITAGDVFSFKVVANPTKCVQKKRVGLNDESEQLRWLTERSPSLGFRIRSLRTTGAGSEKFSKRQQNVTLAKAQYDGVLEVTDAERFRTALSGGIGRAKSYGYGLLTIAKIQ